MYILADIKLNLGKSRIYIETKTTFDTFLKQKKNTYIFDLKTFNFISISVEYMFFFLSVT